MKLSWRGAPPEPEVVEASAPGAGKGRATPKRRDSTVRRGPVTAPKTRKEAYARQRQLAKQGRKSAGAKGSARPRGANAGPMSVQDRREALRRGDPAALPKRDQGPTRQLARDYVDSHRLLSNYLLFLFPIMIASYFVPAASLVTVVIFLALIAEWLFVGRRIRAMAKERYGSAQGGVLTIGSYAGSRAYLPRRWRLPGPRVERGAKI